MEFTLEIYGQNLPIIRELQICIIQSISITQNILQIKISQVNYLLEARTSRSVICGLIFHLRYAHLRSVSEQRMRVETDEEIKRKNFSASGKQIRKDLRSGAVIRALTVSNLKM